MEQNIKLLESRIENLNRVVPYQLNLLATCKTNIHEQSKIGNQNAVRQEKVNSERIIRHLKQLLANIESLRRIVRSDDLDRFDKLTNNSRQNITVAVAQFQDFWDKLRLNYDRQQLESSKAVEDVLQNAEDDERYKQLQLQIQEEQMEQERQAEIAASIQNIQTETQLVNELFHDIASIIQEQKVTVDSLENNVEEARTNVIEAKNQLARAAKVKFAMYPLTGALLGTLIGGPVGLVAGLKIGTVAALSGSVIGFTGGKVIKKFTVEEHSRIVEDVKNDKR